MPEEDRELLEQRREQLAGINAERNPVLIEFAELLELPQPECIVTEPNRYLPAVHSFMEHQVVGDDDLFWTAARIAYLLGEYFVVRLGGRWRVHDDKNSPYFAHLVVGGFTRPVLTSAVVDPFLAADAFCRTPPPRDLLTLVGDIEHAVIEHMVGNPPTGASPDGT